VNSHYAPLPRYAGYWPELWAIWNDEKDFAVTIHYIDRGVDTGNIIAQYPWLSPMTTPARRSTTDARKSASK